MSNVIVEYTSTDGVLCIDFAGFDVYNEALARYLSHGADTAVYCPISSLTFLVKSQDSLEDFDIDIDAAPKFSMVDSIKIKNPKSFITKIQNLNRNNPQIRNHFKPIPDTLPNSIVLCDIFMLLRFAREALYLTNHHTLKTIFTWIFKYFNHYFTPKQFPRVYFRVVLYYVVYNDEVNNDKKLQLVNKSFKFYNIKCMHDVCDCNNDTRKWILKHFFYNTDYNDMIKSFLCTWSICSHGCSLTRYKYGKDTLIPTYISKAGLSYVKHHKYHSIYDMSNSTYSYSFLYPFFHEVFRYGIQFNTMIKTNVLRKLLNKCGYFCLTRINPFDSATIPAIAEFFAQFWSFLMKFLVLRDYDAKLMLKVCGMGVYYSKTKCRNDTMMNTLLNYVYYYFLTNNWQMYKKYYREMNKYNDTPFTPCGLAVTEEFKKQHFGSKSRFLMRLSFLRRRIAFCESTDLPSIMNRKQFLHFFNNEKEALILGNTIMVKECNNKLCQRKDVNLKRCGKCKSVYYCCKLCQKKDWLNHRNVCHQRQCRDFKIVGCSW